MVYLLRDRKFTSGIKLLYTGYLYAIREVLSHSLHETLLLLTEDIFFYNCYFPFCLFGTFKIYVYWTFNALFNEVDWTKNYVGSLLLWQKLLAIINVFSLSVTHSLGFDVYQDFMTRFSERVLEESLDRIQVGPNLVYKFGFCLKIFSLVDSCINISQPLPRN